MHKTSMARLLLVPCLLLALAGCGGPAPAAVRPSVRILAPVTGSKLVVTSGATVTVTVRLAISHFTLLPGGTVAGNGQIRLYENGKFLIQMFTTSSPISLQPGTDRLEAVLLTNGKVVATSAPSVISVTSAGSIFDAAFTKACDAQPPTTTNGGTQGLKPGTITLFCKGFATNSTIMDQSTGTNGDIWFFASGGGPGLEIGRISPSGLTLFTKGVPNLSVGGCGNPGGFAPGPDGNMWVMESTASGNTAIGRITPSGVITMFSQGLPTGAAVVGLQAGPQGDMWFWIQVGPSNYGPQSANSIGRITPSGVITVFTKGLPANSQVSGLMTGPNGNLWFTDQSYTVSSTGSQVPGPSSIGQITPSGVITLFSRGLPANSQISQLMTGPDGNLWFTDQSFTVSSTGAQVPGSTSIGRITPSGVITMFTKGLPANSQITPLKTGPADDMWFTDQIYTTSATGSPVPGPASIGRITPSGVITLSSRGLLAGSLVGNLHAGPQGSLWFTVNPQELSSGTSGIGGIGRITPSGTITVLTKGLPAYSQISGLMTGPDGNLWFQVSSLSGPQSMAMGRLIP